MFIVRLSARLLACLLLSALALAPSASASLTLLESSPGAGSTFNGTGGYSSDGLGQAGTGGTLQADVPAGSTVEQAYLYVTTTTSSGDSVIDLDGQPVTTTTLPDGMVSGYLAAGRATVTELVADKVGSGGAITDFSVDSDPEGVEGVGLVVIYSNPDLPFRTIAVFDGGANAEGDSISEVFTLPLSPTAPGFDATLALGIGFSFQSFEPHECGADVSQGSFVDVNGSRLTSCAGNWDDGVADNGALITVGGVGDSTDNPADPLQAPGDGALPRSQDDELYDLAPFIADGDTTLTFNTGNASQDDNIFLAIASVTGDAKVIDPTQPTFASTSPASPANDNAPEIIGSAPAGTSVSLYVTDDCSGSPVASGTAAEFGSGGISADVADDTTTTFHAVTTDTGGHASACSADTITYVEDSTPSGATTILDGPSDLTTTADASFTYASDDGDTHFECAIDGAELAACPADGESYTGLAEGDHTFSVRSLDAAGNAGPAATHAWTIDRTAPDTVITDGASPRSATTDPTFRFAAVGDESGATLRCRLDGPGAADGAYAACTSPKRYDGLADGDYTLRVVATDAAGNADASPATRSFTVHTPTPDAMPAPDQTTRYIRAVMPAGALSLDSGRGKVGCVADRGQLRSCVARLVDGKGRLLAEGGAPAGSGQSLDLRVSATKAGRRELLDHPLGSVTTMSLVGVTTGGATLRTERPVRILASHRLIVAYPGRGSRLPRSVRRKVAQLARVLPAASAVRCAAHTDRGGTTAADHALTLKIARAACALLRTGGVTGTLVSTGYGHDNAAHRTRDSLPQRRLVLRFLLPPALG